MAFVRSTKQELRIPLNINSFRDSMVLLSNENGTVKTHMTRAAENNHVSRIGRLDLYEEPDEVIQHYKDAGFDIIAEMEKRKGNFLFARARAIDADVANENGDYFSYEELKKEKEIQSDRNKRKIPAQRPWKEINGGS